VVTRKLDITDRELARVVQDSLGLFRAAEWTSGGSSTSEEQLRDAESLVSQLLQVNEDDTRGRLRYDRGSLGYYVGNNRVFKIRQFFVETTWQSVVIVSLAVRLSKYQGIDTAITAKYLLEQLRELTSTITSSFETIRNPSERTVLAALVALQSNPEITDYDAWARGDRDQAVGWPGPSSEQIADAVKRMSAAGIDEGERGAPESGAFTAEEVADILGAMGARGVVSRHGATWRVSW
jgi:hypothetical protein